MRVEICNRSQMDSYLEICVDHNCRYVLCMEVCHPMFDDAFGCTCGPVVLPSDLEISLVYLYVDGRMLIKKVSCRDVAKDFSKRS